MVSESLYKRNKYAHPFFYYYLTSSSYYHLTLLSLYQ